MTRKQVDTVLTALVVVFVLVLAVGQLLGQPVLLGYVTSDSMAPTIEEGDGFVAVPPALAGGVGEGDVVVFNAEELEGGELTTHRVAAETDSGYVTRGDANAVTDQDSGEPPVADERIEAVALQANGWVVTVPHLGTAVTGVTDLLLTIQLSLATVLGTGALIGPQGIGTVLFLVGFCLFVASFLVGREQARSYTRRVSRKNVVDGRLIALALVTLIVLPANAAMLGTAGTHTVAVDGANLPEDVPTDEPLESELTATNGAAIATLVVFETSHEEATLDREKLILPTGEAASATLTAPVPPPDAQRAVTVKEYRYLQVLPPTVLFVAHDVHPLFALGTINLLLLGSVITIVAGVIGLRRRRFRNTRRDVPTMLRLRRWLR